MLMNIMLDRADNGIVTRHDLVANEKIKDKSNHRINLLLSEYWKKYSEKVGLIFTSTVLCKKSKKYYLSMWELGEMKMLEGLLENGEVVQIDYFCVYKKDMFESKKDVIEKYEKTSFQRFFDTDAPKKIEKKETKRIKKVFMKSERDELKKKENGKEKNSMDKFFQKEKKGNIMNFFKANK